LKNSVLLVSTNREKNPYPVAPLGLLFIANALKMAGHEVSLLDLCFSEDVRNEMLYKGFPQILLVFPFVM